MCRALTLPSAAQLEMSLSCVVWNTRHVFGDLCFCGSKQNVPTLPCSISPQLHVLPHGHWLLEVSFVLWHCRKKLENTKWELSCLRQHSAVMCNECGHRVLQIMSPPAYPVPVWPDCSLELSTVLCYDGRKSLHVPNFCHVVLVLFCRMCPA